MADNLVVVESPAKARTIKKYLGKDFEVLASYGHVRDLVPKEGAVDPDRHFAMQYQVLEKSERHVEAIARSLRKSKALFLATDPDREGEAIAWHLLEILKSRGELDSKRVHRVVFYEITRNAIREAVANPREISAELVNAQQARRALDYLVGFNLSPLLWKKVRRGLSAGRVQSPALRMICEREDEIAAFKAQEYWTIEGDAEQAAQSFPLKLIEYRGQKVEQFSFVDERTAREVERTLIEAAGARAAEREASAAHGMAGADGTAGDGAGAQGARASRTPLASAGELRVLAVDRKQRRRNPAPPFTTSTLQQEAARKLGFNARRTMRLAQQLYEGVDIGDGSVGLITYMRTDSVSLAAEAVSEIRSVAARLYGADSVAEEPRVYKTKSKNAQEAHEAIRPTSASIVPADIEGKLDGDLFRLYTLIWRRAVASQMSHAVFDTVAVDLLAGPDGPQRHLLRANGSTLVKPGYIAVYQEGSDDAPGKSEDGDHVLPPMSEGDRVKLLAIGAEQHFTEPPPRYTEASLVKALEEHGIGRPSTYATIISTLQDREYVEMDSRRFVPTDVGKIVNRFLTSHFHKYVEYGFTAALEDELDAVSRGEEDWTTPLRKFWKPFIEDVEHTEKNVSREEVAQARELGRDPATGKPVTVRMGRFGPFVQIGSKDDEEKPRFAGLRPGQKMDAITLAEAMELFKLPRTLGKTAAGETVVANIGRFGPYIKYGDKYVSLREDDPYTVSLERALEVIRLKQEADANRIIADFGAGVQVLNGRYGPYITNGQKNAKIPKGRDPKSLSVEECRELLAQAPERPRRFGRGRRGAGAGAAGGSAATATTGGSAAAPGPDGAGTARARTTSARRGSAASRDSATGTSGMRAAARAAAPSRASDGASGRALHAVAARSAKRSAVRSANGAAPPEAAHGSRPAAASKSASKSGSKAAKPPAKTASKPAGKSAKAAATGKAGRAGARRAR
jgi:DNA topoisomerase I